MRSWFFFLLLLFCCCTSIHRKTVLVGIDPTFYPAPIGLQQDAILGFTLDLLDAVSVKIGYKLKPYNMSWDNLIDGLKMHKYPLIISTFCPTPSTCNQFAFTAVFLETGPLLVVPKFSPIKDLCDLDDKIVGIERRPQEIGLITTFPAIDFVFYNSVEEALSWTIDEEFDAALVPNILARAYVNNLFENGLAIANHNPVITEGFRFISLIEKNELLLAEITRAIESLQDEIHRLMQKWSL